MLEGLVIELVVREINVTNKMTGFEEPGQVELLDVVSTQSDPGDAEEASEEAIIDSAKLRVVVNEETLEVVEAVKQTSAYRSQTICAQVEALKVRTVGEKAVVVKALDPVV